MDSWSDYTNRPRSSSPQGHRQQAHSPQAACQPLHSSVNSPAGHQTTLQDEQCLYDHLLGWARVESPEQLLARFQSLFMTASSYSDQQVWRAIERIVSSPFIDKDFKFILNRCCHILINHWLMHPKWQFAIPALIAQLEAVPLSPGCSRTTKRLRQLLHRFLQTEQFAALKRLAQVVEQPTDWASYDTAPLGSLIRRYPCLYDYSLLTDDSTDEQRKRIRQIRRQVQRQFEQDLAQYAAYKMVDDPVVNPRISTRIVVPAGAARSTRNPTLLSDRKLDAALHQFSGKIDGANTYRDLAQRFITYSRQAPCYDTFKHDLYDYLTGAIDPRYGNTQFNQRLYDHLQGSFAEQNGHCLNDVLLVGTCRRLLSFLVVESTQTPNHAVFVDLLGNLGTAVTIGLLLKIVLICRTVRPYLEKQFAILFKHYEACTRDGVIWLVDSLEHLNIALSLNFGRLTL